MIRMACGVLDDFMSAAFLHIRMKWMNCFFDDDDATQRCFSKFGSVSLCCSKHRCKFHGVSPQDRKILSMNVCFKVGHNPTHKNCYLLCLWCLITGQRKILRVSCSVHKAAWSHFFLLLTLLFSKCLMVFLLFLNHELEWRWPLFITFIVHILLKLLLHSFCLYVHIRGGALTHSR